MSRDQPIHLSSSALSRRLNIQDRRENSAHLCAPLDNSAIPGWPKRRRTSPGSMSGFLTVKAFSALGLTSSEHQKVIHATLHRVLLGVREFALRCETGAPGPIYNTGSGLVGIVEQDSARCHLGHLPALGTCLTCHGGESKDWLRPNSCWHSSSLW